MNRWKNDWMATMKAEGLATDIHIEVINNSKQMFLLKHEGSYGVVNASTLSQVFPRQSGLTLHLTANYQRSPSHPS
jgi:hypothetical protein